MAALVTLGIIFLTSPWWPMVHAILLLKFPHVQQIDSLSFERLREAIPSIMLVDARSPEEFAVSHIAGARLLHVGVSEEALRRFSGPIVTYCSVGYRSALAAERLAALGKIEDVYNLRDGIFGWVRDGRLVVDDHGPVTRVHPFDPWWGSLLVERAKEGHSGPQNRQN